MSIWNSSLVTGHTKIDSDHQHLFSLVAQLGDAMKQGKGRTIYGKILRELADYTKTHFAFEEKMMAQAGYAEFPAHKAKHEKLLADVTEFLRQLEAGEHISTISLLSFLNDWLKQHIQHTDKAMLAALNITA